MFYIMFSMKTGTFNMLILNQIHNSLLGCSRWFYLNIVTSFINIWMRKEALLSQIKYVSIYKHFDKLF